MSTPSGDLHIICERDVGLFSLLQQVVAQIPWALAESRRPVVHFGERCCYWTPEGFEGRRSVWEYYFEPLLLDLSADSIPQATLELILANPPHPDEVGHDLGNNSWASAHFGHHPELQGKALTIPYQWDDPDETLRHTTAELIEKYVRPRAHIMNRVSEFFDREMADSYVIGVHLRGTDAASSEELRAFRHDLLRIDRYIRAINRLIERHPDARVFVATDAESSLKRMREAFGERVIAFDSVRHESGKAAGRGPTGWLLPAYIAEDREVAARNGAEAVIEYLLLTRCKHLVHNGAGMARSVLLTKPALRHTNVHRRNRLLMHLKSLRARGAREVAGEGVDWLKARKPTLRKSARKFVRIGVRKLLGRSTSVAQSAPVAQSIVEQVKLAKAQRKSSSHSYREGPKLSLLVHSFNRVSNVDSLATGLRRLGAEEIVVCEDGSLDGSLERWLHHLTEPNDFLLHSNDLHEIRVSDRAIRMTRGEIVCLLQDDDQLPDDDAWVEEALARFEEHPKLAILGGFMGFRSCGFAGFSPDVRPLWGSEPFQFVHHVNIGPYFIRKSFYEDLGGWDFSFSAVGEPGICFESEICLRAWTRGYEVGYRFVPLKGPDGYYSPDGGTMQFMQNAREANEMRNKAKISELYTPHAGEIDRLVAAANQRIGIE